MEDLPGFLGVLLAALLVIIALPLLLLAIGAVIELSLLLALLPLATAEQVVGWQASVSGSRRWRRPCERTASDALAAG